MAVFCVKNEMNMNTIIYKKLTITSLLAATKQGKEEEIRNFLAQHGLPKNGKITTDYLVLQAAVKRNNKNIVQILTDTGCRINATAKDSGISPLAMAIKNENQEIATILLKKGANFEIGNRSNLTVLHLVVQQKSLKMLQFLFQHNICVNCIRNSKTAFQMFFDSSLPYRQLEDENNIEIFKLFLSKGASIDINHDWSVLHFVTTTKQKDIILMVLQATTNVNQCTNQGNTSLHHLLQESSLDENDIIDIVQSFILKGAKVDIPNNTRDTVFHLAANKKYLKVLQVLFQCQWDVNYCNSKGNTVLHTIFENSSSFCMDDLYYQVVTYILNMKSFEFVQNNLGKFPIHVAIENNHKQIVNDMLLKSGIDVNATKTRLNNYTILHLYLKNLADTYTNPDDHDIEIVRKLILMGAQADITNDEENKTTPMHFALMLKDKTIIQLLLNNFSFQKFDAEQKKSIFHFFIHNIDYSSEAQELEMVEVAESCIKRGANVNFRDDQSKTPLFLAVLRRQKHMVQTLLENGAKMNDFDTRMIIEGLMEREFVQLTYCPSYGSPYNLVMEIIGVTEDIARETEILEMLLKKGMSLENKSNKGFTIFHFAASRMYTEMILKLLPYCKNPNVRDPSQNTLLHAILSSYVNTDDDEEKKLFEIVATLISKGALVLAVNNKGEMPLHLAAKNKHFEISQILLQNGANPTAVDNNGNSVLHFFSMLNFETKANAEFDLIRLFVGQDCDINAKNKEGLTPLLVAAQSGCTMTTRILLQFGAKIDCVADENSSMPLHVAAGCNHFGIVEELIKFGVDVNATRKRNQTALHISVLHKESKVTEILLGNGADTEMKDIDGRTALHWACWYDNVENVNELLSHGANINAEDEVGVIPLLMTRIFTDTWTKVYYHAIKLQAANMMISDLIEKCMIKYEQGHQDDPNVSFANDFFNTAFEEVLNLKEIPIDEEFNLFDVLQMSLKSLCCFNSNQNFQEFLYSNDFEDKFPLYCSLIRACYKKAVVRNGLLILAKEAFKKIIGFTLEENCCEKIFDHLSNQDLRQLDKASKIKLRKRKLFVEDISPICPSKKLRKTYTF